MQLEQANRPSLANSTDGIAAGLQGKTRQGAPWVWLSVSKGLIAKGILLGGASGKPLNSSAGWRAFVLCCGKQRAAGLQHLYQFKPEHHIQYHYEHQC